MRNSSKFFSVFIFRTRFTRRSAIHPSQLNEDGRVDTIIVSAVGSHRRCRAVANTRTHRSKLSNIVLSKSVISVFQLGRAKFAVRARVYLFVVFVSRCSWLVYKLCRLSTHFSSSFSSSTATTEFRFVYSFAVFASERRESKRGCVALLFVCRCPDAWHRRRSQLPASISRWIFERRVAKNVSTRVPRLCFT